MVNIFKIAQNIHKHIMYQDFCTVYSYEDATDEDGATIPNKKKLLYENIPCKVSFSERTWDSFDHKQKLQTPYIKQPKIFIETQYVCEPGYFYEVKRMEPGTTNVLKTYKGQGGVPQVAWSHQEILIDVWGDS